MPPPHSAESVFPDPTATPLQRYWLSRALLKGSFPILNFSACCQLSNACVQEEEVKGEGKGGGLFCFASRPKSKILKEIGYKCELHFRTPIYRPIF